MDDRTKYLKMLQLELADLKEDIQVVIEAARERMTHDGVSRYVCLENMAVLGHEVLGIDNVAGILDGVKPEDFEDLDSMVRELDERFAATIKAHGFPAGVHRMIQRKLAKLADYVRRSP